MERPHVHVYQFATGAHWATGDSVDTYLRRLLEIDFGQTMRADRLAALTGFLDEAFQLAYALGWTGRVREAPQMFALPGMPADEAIYMVAWEQDDGVAYMASPFPLPWLDSKASRFTDSSRAIPAEAEEPVPAPAPAPKAAAKPAPRAAEAVSSAAGLEAVREAVEGPVEEPADPFADYIRREEAARLSREPINLSDEERESGRRFY